jgi:hypothetical protein
MEDSELLSTSTITKYLRTLKNNLYNKTRLLTILEKSGRIQDATGISTTWDIVKARHAALGRFKAFSTLVNQQANILGQATLPPGEYYATVGFAEDELIMNANRPEKIIDIFTTVMKNAESTLRYQIATDFYSDGSLVGGLQGVTGLQAAITGATGTYANINRATAGNEYWQSNVNSTGYALAALEDPTDAGYMPRLLDNQVLAATHDESIDTIIMTKAGYAVYKNISRDKLRIESGSNADLGFPGVKLDGVTITFDDFCTAGYIYGLNMNDWDMFIYPGANFDFHKVNGSIWLAPTDQLAKLAHLIWMGQFRLSAPWQQFRISGLTYA